jgi:putative ABC transport system ATP-binding protein
MTTATVLEPPTSLIPTVAPAARAVEATKVYGRGEAQVRALDSVTVDFAPGRFTAIMGPSGSQVDAHAPLAGLDSLTSGHVFIGAVDLSTLDDKQLHQRRRSRGLRLPGVQPRADPHRSRDIVLPMSLAGASPTAMGRRGRPNSRAQQALRHRPSELGRQQQRVVAVARALASRPEIIFADEPTGNLDSRAGAEILAFMRHAVADLGQTIVMVTHDPVAASYAHRAVFLADGHIVDEILDPTAAAVLDRIKSLGG